MVFAAVTARSERMSMMEWVVLPLAAKICRRHSDRFVFAPSSSRVGRNTSLQLNLSEHSALSFFFVRSPHLCAAIFLSPVFLFSYVILYIPTPLNNYKWVGTPTSCGKNVGALYFPHG